MVKISIVVMLLSTALTLMNCQPKQETNQMDSQIEWANGIVWYQIFPERFHNGDTTNGPTASEVPQAELEPGWQVHPWTSDWYKMQPWELKRSDKFYDVVFTRRYGGDLIGVIQKLDYLKDLGVNGIYFNPIFEAQSLHKYDGSTYHHVDDNFGPDPAGDKARLAAAQETEDPKTWIWTSADSTFLRLLKEAHERDIKVVIDGVFNHTGRAFFAFEDILMKGKKSPYMDWYDITSWDDPVTPENEFDYKGWWGVKSLPEFAEDEQGLVSGPREYVMAATRRWMDPNGDGNPNDGVDGWRLDVIEEVAPAFWRDWYQHVKSINPAAITVGEIWHDASNWIDDERIDGTMNYLFAKAVVDFFIDQETAISGTDFKDRIQEMFDLYGLETLQILWNLMDSHDTDRMPSMVINPDRNYDRNASPRDNPDYSVRKPTVSERKVQKQIAAFQMTFVGAPMIYYGDEAGMWGADDPDDRKPMVWPEMDFAVEKHHPLEGKTRPADPNGFDQELFNFYQRLINIRHNNSSLMKGDYQHLDEVMGKDIFAFIRNSEDQQAVVVFNRSEQKTDLKISADKLSYNNYEEAYTGNEFSVEQNSLKLDIDEDGFVILISR